MLSFKERKAQCVEAGFVGKGENGQEYCPLKGKEFCCNGYRCPTAHHGEGVAHNEKPAGYYKFTALERVGLVEEFKREIDSTEGGRL